MKKSASVFLFIIIIALLSSCASEDNNVSVPDDILKNSQTLFEGNIIEKSGEEKNGIKVWKVKIENAMGAIVTIYWRRNSGSIFAIDAESGPYTYQLNPGMNLLNFSTAKNLVFSAVKSSDLVNWYLHIDGDFDNSWVYEFTFDDEGSLFTAILDASSGDVLEIND